MFGWSIIARACRSASKRAMTCRESIPGLMTLRATRRRTGSCCSAMKTVPMPPSPIGLQQLVRADDRAGLLALRAGIGLGYRRRRGRGFEEVVAPGIGDEESLDAPPQLGVCAGPVEVRRPGLGAIQLQGGMEDVLDIRSWPVASVSPRSPPIVLYRGMRRPWRLSFRGPGGFQMPPPASPASSSSRRSHDLA